MNPLSKSRGPDRSTDEELTSLAHEVAEIARRLAVLSVRSSRQAMCDAGSLERAALVREYLRARRLRERILPAELFADPAWDILLDLFAAGLEGKIVSISSACIASAVPPTTALRWLNKLEEMGMVQRTDDAEDARRAYVQITPTAQDAIQHWLALSPLLAAASSRATD